MGSPGTAARKGEKSMKKLLSGLVALSLTSCTTLSGFPAVPGFDPGNPQTTVGPVTNRVVPGLMAAWRTYDTLLTAVDVLITAGVIRPGTPRATHLADALDRVRNALNAATNAVRAGNATDYTSAMALVAQAFGEARTAFGGS
jgi:hypothetical protein